MPVLPSVATKRISQKEFGDLAYEVLSHVFEIHGEFGRFFDESVYKKELAARLKEVLLEVAVTVVHGTFSKTFYADVLVGGGGLFEFKAADAIHPRHRAQAIHYLHLLDLGHGKIINVRTEQVKHEFVNCQQRLCQLTTPQIHDGSWDASLPQADTLRAIVMNLVADWGTGLDVTLYEEAVTHFLGGETVVNVCVPVSGQSGLLGSQPMRLASPAVAFKITTHSKPDAMFRTHSERLLRHTPLKALQWINIVNQQVSFTTIHS